MKSPSVLILAGEASGDYHAAAMVRHLREIVPDVRVTGIGGDRLADAGMTLLHHYREVNSVALSGGTEMMRSVIRAYGTMKRELRSGEHDVFIPVDFPDVNIRLCLLAKRAGVPVCYYVSPQIWAWRKGRIHKIARRVDHMMTIFPFEEELYRSAGVPATFVGHTMVRESEDYPDRAMLRHNVGLDPERFTVALVPGSRQGEIARMLPPMCGAAAILREKHPEAQIVLPLAAEHLRSQVEAIVSAHGVDVLVSTAGAREVMAASDCGLVTSGTATLQAALAGMPHAVAYIVAEWKWWLALNVIKPIMMDEDVHLAIANVLSIHEEKNEHGPIQDLKAAGIEIPCLECGRPLFVPEVLQYKATPEELAAWLFRFREEPELRNAMMQGFRRICSILNPDRAPAKAEEIVARFLNKGEQSPT